jgi:hypothetical protein
MDVHMRKIAAAVAATLAVGFCTSAWADPDDVTSRSTYVNDNGRVVHCVSTESGRTYCGSAHMRYVIRGTPAPVCVEGHTYGFDDRGVWVTGGCTADFVMSANTVTGSSTVVTNSGRIVHCVSTASGRTFCGRPHTRYVIRNAPPACVEGTTWGFDDEHGIWVTGGCKADFEIDD